MPCSEAPAEIPFLVQIVAHAETRQSGVVCLLAVQHIPVIATRANHDPVVPCNNIHVLNKAGGDHARMQRLVQRLWMSVSINVR